MANTFVLNSVAYKERYMYITCTQTTDIENNTSKIDWTLTVTGGSSNYYSTGPTTVVINGIQVYYKGRVKYTTETFPAAKGSVSGTIIVAHDIDGTKSIDVSISTAIYNSTVKTTTDTWILDSIPRFATIVSAPIMFNDEENPTITYYNPAGTSITYLMACISLTGEVDDIKYRDISPTETSYMFELTEDEREILRMATLNGSNKRSVQFIVRSYIGTEFSDSVLTKDFCVINADPILTTKIEDVDKDTLILTGGNNNYIKGYSDLKVTLNADVKKVADIESYNVKLGEDIKTGSEIVFTDIQSNNLFIECKDNRGLYDTYQSQDNINIINYFRPTISAKGIIEMEEETTAKVNIVISGTFFNDNFGVVDNNIDVFINYTGADDWVSLTDDLYINGNNYSVEFNINNLDYLKSFVYQVKVEDKLDSSETNSYTLKMLPVFDWGENDFNFNVPIMINRTPLFDLIYPIGSIYMSVNFIDPSTIFGGIWERIQDRFLFAAGDTYNAGSVGGSSTTTLTIENLPSHSHEATSEYIGGSLLFRGPSDENHNIVDVSLGGDNITKTTYEGSDWGNSISTSTTDRAPEQINIGGTVSTTIGNTGSGSAINILPPYLTVYMWKRTK